jgi:hypothetical protein
MLGRQRPQRAGVDNLLPPVDNAVQGGCFCHKRLARGSRRAYDKVPAPPIPAERGLLHLVERAEAVQPKHFGKDIGVFGFWHAYYLIYKIRYKKSVESGLPLKILQTKLKNKNYYCT